MCYFQVELVSNEDDSERGQDTKQKAGTPVGACAEDCVYAEEIISKKVESRALTGVNA